MRGISRTTRLAVQPDVASFLELVPEVVAEPGGWRIGSVAEGLDLRAHVVRWDPVPTAGVVLELCALARLARDVG